MDLDIMKIEPWFDDFGDTDELPDDITVKEWKSSVKANATNSQVGGDHYKNQDNK